MPRKVFEKDTARNRIVGVFFVAVRIFLAIWLVAIVLVVVAERNYNWNSKFTIHLSPCSQAGVGKPSNIHEFLTDFIFRIFDLDYQYFL